MVSARPNLGLQIALIIFVLITIALAVFTFMFFKENEEAQLGKKDAETKMVKAQEERTKSEAQLNQLKTVVGKGPQDKVETILEEFQVDMKTYQDTYAEPTQNYSLAVQRARDSYLKLQDQIKDLGADIERLKSEAKAQADKDSATIGQLREDLASQKDDVAKIHTTIEVAREEIEKNLGDLNSQLDAKRKLIQEEEAKNKVAAEKLKSTIDDQKRVLDNTQQELDDLQRVDFAAPDGTIVRVNQRERTVWIDAGQLDGIKPQMTFTVYDRNVANTADKSVKPKGSIEVSRVLDSHLSEARITEDQITNPILPQDKIMSVTFRVGKPERFAVAGLIDIDGDGKSDLNQLLTVIRTNGGIVDAVVDDEGNRSGAVSAATKLLVLGDRPTENVRNPDVLEKYSNLIKEAENAHVQIIPVKDFLKYMGYQGRERSTPLGRTGGLEEDAAKKGEAFRKRPGREAKPGAAFE